MRRLNLNATATDDALFKSVTVRINLCDNPLVDLTDMIVCF